MRAINATALKRPEKREERTTIAKAGLKGTN